MVNYSFLSVFLSTVTHAVLSHFTPRSLSAPTSRTLTHSPFSLSRLLRCLPPSPYPPHRVRPPSSPLPPKTHPFMSWSLCVTTPGLVRKLPAPFVLWMKMCSRMSHPFAPTRRSTRRWNLFWQRCSPVYGHADSLSRSCRDSLATGCCWCHLRGKIFCQMIRYSAVDMELFATT